MAQAVQERKRGPTRTEPFARDDVLHALGYRPGKTRASDAALEAVEEGMQEALGLLRPLMLYADARLECAGPDATLRVPSLGLEWRSPALTAVLAGAEHVALFAGTVGAAISEAARVAFQQGAYTRAVVLDACGTAAAKALADRARAEAEAVARARGYRVTIPYSPGYRDWDIADTGPLLRALEARRIGLQESDSHYLLPEKSFCGVIGWTRGLEESPQASGCAICFLPGCRYRKTPPVGEPGVAAIASHVRRRGGADGQGT